MDEAAKEGTRGIKSEKFKRAYNNLFGNLEAEKRAFEERHLTAVAVQ